MRRRWTINGRFLAQPATGVQRYAEAIVRNLDRLLAEDAALAATLEVDLAVPRDASPPPPLEAIAVRDVGRLRGHAWEQAELPIHAPGGLVSLCNTGPLAHRRQIVCIHDANTRSAPQSYSRAFRAFYRLLLPALGRTSVAVTTVSHFSAGELAHYRICRAGKITVAPNGHEHVAAWRPAAGEPAAGRARDTIVLLGSPAPHKNVGLILGLAEQLHAEGLKVAVVGAADPRVFRSALPAGGQGVAWCGRLGDAELAALLDASLCLAFPSLTEGFGLPPLEAMALGCPVVASDRASLPEVCGDAVLYAAPDEPEAWLRHFRALSQSPDLHRAMAERGRARADRFRWRDSAKRYLHLMAAADGVALDRTPNQASPFAA